MTFQTLGLLSLFFLTAVLYSAVGFGGGSTYTALLVLTNEDYILIPILSLSCNIIVVFGNVIFAIKKKLIDLKTSFPLIAFSVPSSFIGGVIPISELFFVSLLAVVLFGAGVQMLRKPIVQVDAILTKPTPKLNGIKAGAIGGVLGFIAGLVGIGGGIFLAPVLYALKWGHTRNIAAICSLFILVNSCAGLFGQLTKLGVFNLQVAVHENWVLIIAVFLGGIIGRNVSFSFLSETVIKRITAGLILFVAMRLAFKVIQILNGV